MQVVEFLLSADSTLQKSLLKAVHDDFITFLGEMALNILEGVIPLSKHFKRKLQPHAAFIRNLGSKRLKATSRRRLCVTKSELIVSILKAVHSDLTERFS